MKEKATFTGIIIGSIMLICCILYGSYWVAKTVSYNFFYEDMVQTTITEMVKPESLVGFNAMRTMQKNKGELFVLPPAPRYPALPDKD